MNSEQIKTKASNAIETYLRDHSSHCYLDVVNGKVVAFPLKDAEDEKDQDLILTPYHQCAGCTPAKWSLIGTALLNLYNKEKACQAHQKP